MKWETRMIETERGVFEVFEKGEGPPLAVTHLYSEFNETGDYFAEAFVDTHHVYLINLKNCGNSDQVTAAHEMTMLDSVLDLEAVREGVGLDRWGFAGHSTGGMLGVVYGIYFSIHLHPLIIANAAAREYMTFSEDCIYHSSHPDFSKMQRLVESLKQKDLSPESRRILTTERTKLSLRDPDLHDHYFNGSIEKKMSTSRMNFFSRELHTFDVSRKLPLIAAETVIISGAYDVQCPPEYSKEMADAIPGADHIVFTMSNHYPHLEEKERFQKVLLDYFD